VLELDLKKTRRRARGIMMMNTHVKLLMRGSKTMMMGVFGLWVEDTAFVLDRSARGKKLS
jgi:hypothetical protein